MLELERDGRVATLRMVRPPVNAINDAWLERLDALLGELEQADGITVLRIESGARAFCAGADLAQMKARFATAEGRAELVAVAARMQELFARLEALPLLTIAVIGGAAVGGGCERALACDLRVVATTARIGLSETRLGLLPGAGGTQRMTRLCGEAVARRLVLTGELLDGSEAATLGLAHWAVAREELGAFVDALVERSVPIPRAAIGYSKVCIAAAVQPGADGYAAELDGSARLYADPETQRLVQAFLDGFR